jgi:ClpX C4-type zinc finger protein
MKKQFRVEVDGRDPVVIDINDNEAIDIHVDSQASKYFESHESTLGLRITGMRWSDDGFFNFNWGRVALGLDSAVRIAIVEGEDQITPVHEEERFVEPEKECSFCERPASQVKHLVDGGMFARICDECIVECQQLINDKSAI